MIDLFISKLAGSATRVNYCLVLSTTINSTKSHQQGHT